MLNLFSKFVDLLILSVQRSLKLYHLHKDHQPNYNFILDSAACSLNWKSNACTLDQLTVLITCYYCLFPDHFPCSKDFDPKNNSELLLVNTERYYLREVRLAAGFE
jgi:hypothetical protein